jgi:hypothetical protein
VEGQVISSLDYTDLEKEEKNEFDELIENLREMYSEDFFKNEIDIKEW